MSDTTTMSKMSKNCVKISISLIIYEKYILSISTKIPTFKIELN